MDPGTAMLRSFHARYAGGASDAFGPGDAGDGRNSYEHLLDALPAARRVLDAGCGDGVLLERLGARRPGVVGVGVDMSPEELACARARLGDRAELIQATLDAVPLPDASVDAVVSHMVLMVITDAGPALDELRRLLRPGGALVAVVGRRFEMPDPQRALMRHLWRRLDDEGGAPPALGDPRFGDLEGLREVFGGWGRLRTSDLTLRIDVPVDAAVRFLQRIWYGMDRLSPAGWAEAGALLRDDPELAPGGVFAWTMGLRVLAAQR